MSTFSIISTCHYKVMSQYSRVTTICRDKVCIRLFSFENEIVKLQIAKEDGVTMEDVDLVSHYKMVDPQSVTHIPASCTAVLSTVGVGTQNDIVIVLNVWTTRTEKVGFVEKCHFTFFFYKMSFYFTSWI